MPVEAKVPQINDSLFLPERPALTWELPKEWREDYIIPIAVDINPNNPLKVVDAVTGDECPWGYSLNNKGKCKPDSPLPTNEPSEYPIPDWVLTSPIDPDKFIKSVCKESVCNNNIYPVDSKAPIEENDVRKSFSDAVYGKGVLEIKEIKGERFTIIPVKDKNGNTVAEYRIPSGQTDNFFKLLVKTPEEMAQKKEEGAEGFLKTIKCTSAGIVTIFIGGAYLLYRLLKKEHDSIHNSPYRERVDMITDKQTQKEEEERTALWDTLGSWAKAYEKVLDEEEAKRKKRGA